MVQDVETGEVLALALLDRQTRQITDADDMVEKAADMEAAVIEWLQVPHTLTELKNARDLTAGTRHWIATTLYARQAKIMAGNSLAWACAEIEITLGEAIAQRQANGLLATNRDNQYTISTSYDATIKSTYEQEGFTKQQASRWKIMAKLPEADRLKYRDEAKEKLWQINSSELFYRARKFLQGQLERKAKGKALPVGDFSILYADPPWQYEHVRTSSRAIENHYPTMPFGELCALPIPKLAGDNAVLFLWATSPKLFEALLLLGCWGFTYRTCMVWVKDRIGMGYYARQRHELLLIGIRGHVPLPAPSDRPDSVVTAPRGRHSEKPAVLYELIERMYPDQRKVELFSRNVREGWTGWGFDYGT